MIGVHILQQLGRSRNVYKNSFYTNIFTGRVKLRKELSYNISPCCINANHSCHTKTSSQHVRWASTRSVSERKVVGNIGTKEERGIVTAVGNIGIKEERGIVTVYRKTRFAVEVLWNGCKNLYYDVKLATHIRRKLGIVIRGDYSRLTRDEVLHMHQTQDDVLKTVPIVIMFWMVPLVGKYIAAALAYLFPRQLLSRQFIPPDQKEKSILEKYHKRRQNYVPLIEECADACNRIEIRDLFNICTQIINGNSTTNHELLQFKEKFSESGVLSLYNIPLYHLEKLCNCWLISTCWYVPRLYLLKSLQKKMSRLHLDDKLIHREGVSKMTNENIAKALHFRGIDASVLDLSSMTLLLEDWVRLSSQLNSQELSLLAHCVAFKGVNFRKL